MTLFIPALILAFAGVDAPYLDAASGWQLVIAGCVLIAVGLGLLRWTVVLFDRVGEGTLGVGEPVNLVVRGPYRHVRNPMMTGVFCILLGTAAATASFWLLGWFALYCTIMAIVIRTFEEPHLSERYGAEYEAYRRHVPRWIPRLTAWQPSRS